MPPVRTPWPWSPSPRAAWHIARRGGLNRLQRLLEVTGLDVQADCQRPRSGHKHRRGRQARLLIGEGVFVNDEVRDQKVRPPLARLARRAPVMWSATGPLVVELEPVPYARDHIVVMWPMSVDPMLLSPSLNTLTVPEMTPSPPFRGQLGGPRQRALGKVRQRDRVDLAEVLGVRNLDDLFEPRGQADVGHPDLHNKLKMLSILLM